MSTRVAAAAVALAALVAVAMLAGRRDGSSDGEGAPHERLVRETVPRIEASIGIPFKRPPVVEVRSREQVRSYVEATLEDSLAREQVDGQEAVLEQLGLIPDTMSLRALLLDVLEEQIGGYYDPRTKVLYIVEGSDEEIIGVTVTHELVHALQDQYVNLDSITRATGNDDRQAAAHAVIEGQATLEQMRLTFGAEMPAIPATWGRIREMIRSQQAEWPALAGAPTIIQEMLVFPYLSGAEFMKEYRGAGPGSVPYQDMPTSTEQVMHPGRYNGTRDVPTVVTLPPLPAGSVLYENTLGEFTTRIFLWEHLRDQQGAIAGANGWDGDRYAVVRTSRGDGIVWVSVWDSITDGAEFYELLDRTTDRRYGPSTARALTGAQAGAGMTAGRMYSVGGRAIAVTTGEIGGRPVVVYVNLPAGEDPLALDLSRIRLEQ